jgi:hypothetical protein
MLSLSDGKQEFIITPEGSRNRNLSSGYGTSRSVGDSLRGPVIFVGAVSRMDGGTAVGRFHGMERRFGSSLGGSPFLVGRDAPRECGSKAGFFDVVDGSGEFARPSSLECNCNGQVQHMFMFRSPFGLR